MCILLELIKGFIKLYIGLIFIAVFSTCSKSGGSDIVIILTLMGLFILGAKIFFPEWYKGTNNNEQRNEA